MKMMTKSLMLAAVASAALIASRADALLPPLFETINEYKELISSPELGKKLDSGEAIVDIERREGGFLIITNKSTLEVVSVREPQTQPGPAKYQFTFQEKAPL